MTLRVASYNIRKAIGLDRRRHPARILDVINEIDADIVVLQEADKRLGQRPSALPHHMLERETDYRPAELARTQVSLGWHGNAILIRQGVPHGACGHIDLPALEPRGAVFLTLPLKGETVTIVGTHLGLVGRWRRRQMAAIRDHVGTPLSHTLIAGDFNEWSASNGFEPWAEDFSIVAPGATFHAARPVASLDRFVHGSALTLSDANVHRSPKSRIASDHLPIFATVSVS